MEDVAAAAPANPLRGEFDLVLDGQVFTLRPSYEAILAVEAQSGKTLLELARAADNLTISLTEAAIVSAEFIRAWGRETDTPSVRGINTTRVGELIHENGLVEVAARLALVLLLASTGGCKSSGEAKAVTGMKTTETPVAALQE